MLEASKKVGRSMWSPKHGVPLKQTELLSLQLIADRCQGCWMCVAIAKIGGFREYSGGDLCVPRCGCMF